jgi:hypothetical protein
MLVWPRPCNRWCTYVDLGSHTQPEVSEVEYAKATRIHCQLKASYILSKTHLNGEGELLCKTCLFGCHIIVQKNKKKFCTCSCSHHKKNTALTQHLLYMNNACHFTVPTFHRRFSFVMTLQSRLVCLLESTNMAIP